MPMTTYLSQHEYLENTENQEINRLLDQVRLISGEDWRVHESVILARKQPLFSGFRGKRKYTTLYTLYFGALNNGEFQIINFYTHQGSSINYAESASAVANFLMGYYNGHQSARLPKSFTPT
jgi:hypothetical protein